MSGDQAVHSGGGNSRRAARTRDLRRANVVVPCREHHWKAAQRGGQSPVLLVSPHAGENLLVDDTRHDQRLVPRDQPSEGFDYGWLGDAASPSKDGGENRRVQDNQRRFRARL